MHELLEALNGDLIRKYEQIRSPYYTTYPTGGEWDSDFDHSNYADALKQSTSPGQKCLWLYTFIFLTVQNSAIIAAALKQYQKTVNGSQCI